MGLNNRLSNRNRNPIHALQGSLQQKVKLTEFGNNQKFQPVHRNRRIY